MKVLVIVPAYNEEGSIERVVENLRRNFPQYDCIVVNDGSKDRTAEICRGHHYEMLDFPVNLGLTGAFQAGMRYAYRNGYDAAIQIDGDGQHDPRYIEAMAAVMEQEKADIVIGSRFCEKKKPRSLRMFGSNLISGAIRLTTGKRLTDPTSGMRLYNREMMQIFSDQINYGPEPDTMAHLIRCGAKIEEVQVEMYERMAGTSYLNFARSIQYMVNTFFSILFIQFFRPRRYL